jgi:signal peptidase II
MKVYKYFLIALVIILFDQASKLLVYKYMYLHEEVNVIGEWFRLHYLLNPGMAFGIRWQSEFGKLALTIFRIGAMFGIGFYLFRMASKQAHNGFLICMAMILGGAIGNVIDSTFYGVFLNNAPIESPTQWFHGQVIDMLYFPLFHFYWPEWMPLKGGEYFEFFSPVFNIADSSIFLGVAMILIYQRRFFKEREEGFEVVSQNATAEKMEISISENGNTHTEQQIIIEESHSVEKRENEKPSDSLNSEQATL